jgi:hypothetical protein
VTELIGVQAMTNDSKTDYPLRDTGVVVIEPAARPWYDRLTLSTAIIMACETIDEWSYEQDAHGYCHDRSVLLRLVEAARVPAGTQHRMGRGPVPDG